jgi:hypothetical protein
MARTPPRRRGTPKAPSRQPRTQPYPGTQGRFAFGWGGQGPSVGGRAGGGGPATGIPSTGTNAPVGTPGLPVDPIFSNDIGTAQRTHDTTVSGLLTQRANTASAYGYTPTYDEQGLIRSLAVDPNNPYAKANLLRKSHTENRARTLGSMASRGQLYSGALGVGQGINDENYQQGSDALQKSFIDFIARNQGQITGANTNYANALAGADSERVSRAVAADQGDRESKQTQDLIDALRGGSGSRSAYNPYTPGTPDWAKYAKQHGQSWKTDSKGRWGYYVNGKWKKA